MKTVLAIGAHPDDIEIGCGGTISVLLDKGYRILPLVVTSGEEGDLHDSKEQLGDRRESEARSSAAALGASDVIFLHEPDGLTNYSKGAKIKLISVLRELRPEIVFTHSSSDHFPDHQIVHRLAQDALVAASGPWYPEAGGSPHAVEKVYGYEVWHPLTRYQMSIDISHVIERKLTALRCHASQTKGVDYLEAVRGLALFRGAMTMRGKYAEVFEVLKTNLEAGC